MAEIILFILILAIVVPSLLVSSVLYNLNRRLQGKKTVSTEEAIKNSFTSALKSSRKFVESIFGAAQKKVEEQKNKPKVEDAEYREVK